jgi:hypothetical protein
MPTSRCSVDAKVHTRWHWRRCPSEGDLGNGGGRGVEARGERGGTFHGSVHGGDGGVRVVATRKEDPTTTLGVNFERLGGAVCWPNAQHADTFRRVRNGVDVI